MPPKPIDRSRPARHLESTIGLGHRSERRPGEEEEEEEEKEEVVEEEEEEEPVQRRRPRSRSRPAEARRPR